MDTTIPTGKDAHNSAVAAMFRARKAELRITFDALEAATGLKQQTLKRLVNDHRPIHIGDFMSVAFALELDPAAVIDAAEARVKLAHRD